MLQWHSMALFVQKISEDLAILVVANARRVTHSYRHVFVFVFVLFGLVFVVIVVYLLHSTVAFQHPLFIISLPQVSMYRFQ